MAYRDWYCEDVLSGKIEVKGRADRFQNSR